MKVLNFFLAKGKTFNTLHTTSLLYAIEDIVGPVRDNNGIIIVAVYRLLRLQGHDPNLRSHIYETHIFKDFIDPSIKKFGIEQEKFYEMIIYNQVDYLDALILRALEKKNLTNNVEIKKRIDKDVEYYDKCILNLKCLIADMYAYQFFPKDGPDAQVDELI